MDLMTKAGGFLNALHKSMMILVIVFCTVSSNAQLMYIIFQKKTNLQVLTDDDVKTSQLLIKIQQAGFQIKYQIFKVCCCGSKKVEEFIEKHDPNFDELQQFYDRSSGELLNELTLGTYIKNINHLKLNMKEQIKIQQQSKT